jgi:hypothetical protein
VAIIKEFACLEHGPFEGSHPICPEYGCASTHVTQEFRTAPKIRHGITRRTDAGLRTSSEMYGKDWRSAREGEMSHRPQEQTALGQKVLWGSEINKEMGRSFAEMTGVAQKPLIVKKRDGSGELRLDRNNAMREAATESGITSRCLPRAGGDVTGAADTSKEAARALTV